MCGVSKMPLSIEYLINGQAQTWLKEILQNYEVERLWLNSMQSFHIFMTTDIYISNVIISHIYESTTLEDSQLVQKGTVL